MGKKCLVLVVWYCRQTSFWVLRSHLLERICVHGTRTEREQSSHRLAITSILSAFSSSANVASKRRGFARTIPAGVIACELPIARFYVEDDLVNAFPTISQV